MEDEEARIRALAEGPWIINEHYLVVRKWKPGVTPSKDTIISTTVAWFRVPERILQRGNTISP